jgi:hypothetical protein
MRDVAWRMGLTLAALGVLLLLGPGVSCSLDNRLLERVMGHTPQAQIARYLAAVAEGDRQAAEALWPASSEAGDLAARREAVTGELLAYGPRLTYQLLNVEWWRTCCEPGVIDDPGEAGAARVLVAIHGETRPEVVYVFDLWVPGGYAGEAAGHPLRQWAIADVYPQGTTPLAWTWR